MANAHPQGGDEQLQALLQHEVGRITEHLARSCQQVLNAFKQKRTDVTTVITNAENQLFQLVGFISTEEAAAISAYLKEVWEAFERTNRDVERPLQLAQRASRRLLIIPASPRFYEVARDYDADDDEVQRRINASRNSDFWNRITYRTVLGLPPQVQGRERRHAQIASYLLPIVMQHWTDAWAFAYRHMNVAKQNLQLALRTIQAAFDRTETPCPELQQLAFHLRRILTAIDQEILESFRCAMTILSLIETSVDDERNSMMPS